MQGKGAEGEAAGSAVDSFLSTLKRLDFGALDGCLAPDVWFRALVARGSRETTTARGLISSFREWFEGDGQGRLLAGEHYTMAGREFVSYRFLLRPEWQPDQWHVVEQVGFCKEKDGRISRLDVVCTGFHPCDENGIPQRAE